MLLYLDCTNGVSGEMLIAALLDASGVKPAAQRPLDRVVRPALKAAGIDPRLATLEAVQRDEVAAFVFRVADAPAFATLDELIMSTYASGVEGPHADAVAAVAERLREAARAMQEEDDSYLSERSGVDTAVQLIAATALIHDLAPDRVVASPPALGGGAVQTPQGELAVPTAAVLHLLHGLPVDGAGFFEEP
jgi:pyridinium-3,5-bisthiocarboxylic acid mononucleotide nickel chelatase